MKKRLRFTIKRSSVYRGRLQRLHWCLRALFLGTVFFMGLPGSASAEDYSRYAPPPAPEETIAPSQQKAQYRPRVRPSRYRLFGGIDLGYASLQSSVPGENARDGYRFGLRATGSFHSPSRRWAYEASIGWMRTQLEETINSPGRQEVSGLITRAGLVEISPLYRFNPRVSVGPLAQVQFGTDLRYAPDFQESQASAPLFVGVQGFYEWPMNSSHSSLMRIGAQLTTDFSIAQRQLYGATLLFQYGIPFGQKDPRFKEPAPAPRPSQGVEITYDANSVLIELKSEFVNFDTNKADIKPEFQAYLDAVGAVLSRRSDLWKSLVVEGHTDNRGGYDYNMKLSARRATAVGRALVQQGIASQRIRVRAFGYTRPLDSANDEEAWARNRRVEIKFHGVTQPKELALELQMIQ